MSSKNQPIRQNSSHDNCLHCLALKQRDRTIWGRVFMTHRDRLLSRLKARGASEPDLSEIYHEAMEKTINYIQRDEFDCSKLPDCSLPALLWRIAIWTYLGWRRKNKKDLFEELELKLENGWEPHWKDGIEALQEKEAMIAKVEHNLKRLKQRDEDIIELRIMQDLSFREVAEQMNYYKSDGTPDDGKARVYYSRAIQNLTALNNE